MVPDESTPAEALPSALARATKAPMASPGKEPVAAMMSFSELATNEFTFG